MKKLLLISLMILVSFFAFGQEVETEDIQEYMDEFDIEVETFLEDKILEIIDFDSEDSDDVSYQLSYIYTAFKIIFEEEELSFKDVGIEHIIYRFFLDEDDPVEVHMGLRWVMMYANVNTKSREKRDMLSELIDNSIGNRFEAHLENQYEQRDLVEPEGPAFGPQNKPVGRPDPIMILTPPKKDDR